MEERKEGREGDRNCGVQVDEFAFVVFHDGGSGRRVDSICVGEGGEDLKIVTSRFICRFLVFGGGFA